MELLTVSLSDHHRTPDFSSIMSQVSCLSKKSVKKNFQENFGDEATDQQLAYLRKLTLP